MTRFEGGPYDGKDLPFDPEVAKTIRLPAPEEMSPFLNDRQVDPGATEKHDWPFVYELDETRQPPVYQFAQAKSSRGHRPG